MASKNKQNTIIPSWRFVVKKSPAPTKITEHKENHF